MICGVTMIEFCLGLILTLFIWCCLKVGGDK